MSDAIVPFHLEIPQGALDDLQRRLAATRWPEAETTGDWSQGAPLADVQALVRYWREDYDWRRCERMLNGFGQFRTEIDGLDIHFLHVRSPHPGALPLIMTHGWPGSVIEFHKVIGPLVDPPVHGGDAADAFEIVCPSLPGYGFSGKPATPGWSPRRIADAWIALMGRLGYERWAAQGGDWGAFVTAEIGAIAPRSLAGVHLNMVSLPFPDSLGEPTAAERAILETLAAFRDQGSAYARQQGTRPQTLAYGLTDSPAGQAAWIYEKFREWSDCGGLPERVFTRDELLDNIMFYWLPAAGGSSARLYWEMMRAPPRPPVTAPTAVSIFPGEPIKASRRWAETGYPNIIYWNELDKGGHFAAFEQPELFVRELRTCFRALR